MQAEQGVSFGPYRLAGPRGPLFRKSLAVNLPPKALAVLWELVTRAGQVVTKEELLATVWAGTVVGEETLTAFIGILRRALKDASAQPRYIATVHRQGYRFIASLTPPLRQGSGVGDQGLVRESQNEVERLPAYAAFPSTPDPRPLFSSVAMQNSPNFASCLPKR